LNLKSNHYSEEQRSCAVFVQSPYNRALLLFGFILIMLLIAFFVGYRFGVSGQSGFVDNKSQLKQQIESLQAKQKELSEQVAIYRYGGELDKQVSERIRQENLQLQNKVSELNEAVGFYRGIMAPNDRKKGLQIEEFNLQPVEGSRRYRYEVVLTQAANNSAYISGKLLLTLHGAIDKKEQAISHQDLLVDANKRGQPFKFRFFQNLKGQIQLPEGFEPVQIDVSAQSSGRKAAKIKRTYTVKLEKGQISVGQREE